MTINTGAISKLLRPGLNSVVGLAYNMWPQEWQEIYDIAEASDMSYEEDMLMYGTGLAPQKPQQGGIQFDSMQQWATKRYDHIVYAIGYSITREAVEDNLYVKQAMEIAQQIAFSIKQTMELVGANQLNIGNTSSVLAGDGISLFNTAHTLGKGGGTYNNTLLTQADLSEASAEQSLIDIEGTLNDAGLPMQIKAQKLLIHRSNQFEACRIFDSPDRYNTAERSINAMNYMGVLPGGVHINHYFTNPAAYFFKTDALKGMRFFLRRAMEVENDTPDFCTENMNFKGTVRFSVGCTDWRGIYGVFGP